MHYFTVRILIFLFLYLHCKKYRMRPTAKGEDLKHQLHSKRGQYRANLISRTDFVSSVSYKFLPNTNLYSLITCIYDATCHLPLVSLCLLLHKRWQILRISKHSELRDLRSEGIHFKYKFMVLIITLMPQIKEAFVGSQHKYKIYIPISIRVLFWCLTVGTMF